MDSLQGQGTVSAVRLQSADVKFLRACSFLFMRFRPGAECLGAMCSTPKHLEDLNEMGSIEFKMV